MKSDKFIFSWKVDAELVQEYIILRIGRNFYTAVVLKACRYCVIFFHFQKVKWTFHDETSKNFVVYFFSHRPTPIYLIADHPWIILYKNQLTRDGFNKISEKIFVFLHFFRQYNWLTGTSFLIKIFGVFRDIAKQPIKSQLIYFCRLSESFFRRTYSWKQ